jgi:hypothetical protein
MRGPRGIRRADVDVVQERDVEEPLLSLRPGAYDRYGQRTEEPQDLATPKRLPSHLAFSLLGDPRDVSRFVTATTEFRRSQGLPSNRS